MVTYLSSTLERELLMAKYCILLNFYLPHPQIFGGYLTHSRYAISIIKCMDDY